MKYYFVSGKVWSNTVYGRDETLFSKVYFFDNNLSPDKVYDEVLKKLMRDYSKYEYNHIQTLQNIT